MKKWFPYNAASELSSARAWTTAQPLPHPVQDELRLRLQAQPAHLINWEVCWQISQDLNLPYAKVWLLLRMEVDLNMSEHLGAKQPCGRSLSGHLRVLSTPIAAAMSCRMQEK